MTNTDPTPAQLHFRASLAAARALLDLVGPTDAQLADFRAYSSGAAITQNLADQLGPDHGKRVLTPAEFVMVSAVSYTVPSTPANNVWD